MSGKIMVISHRGVPPLAPEHTFEGYDLAIEQGTFHIEQDLQLTRDEELIISHDPFLERTTSGTGRIAEMDAEDVLQAKFTNGEHIHSLDAVFARYGKTIKYVIETKFNYATTGDYRGEDRFIALIQKHDVAEQVIFQSFHPASLAYLRKSFPEIPSLLLIKRTANYQIEQTDLSKIPYIDMLCFESQLLTPESAALARQGGKEVFVYFEKGDDTPENFAKMLEIGIQGVFTDYTADVIRVLGKENYR